MICFELHCWIVNDVLFVLVYLWDCRLTLIFYLQRESVIMQPPPPPPPPKEPTFSCPICMGPLVEEMSTRCGHIFCKACIKTAISTQAKCPTCRKHVTVKELIRVFLPSTSWVEPQAFITDYVSVLRCFYLFEFIVLLD